MILRHARPWGRRLLVARLFWLITRLLLVARRWGGISGLWLAILTLVGRRCAVQTAPSLSIALLWVALRRLGWVSFRGGIAIKHTAEHVAKFATKRRQELHRAHILRLRLGIALLGVGGGYLRIPGLGIPLLRIGRRLSRILWG